MPQNNINDKAKDAKPIEETPVILSEKQITGIIERQDKLEKVIIGMAQRLEQLTSPAPSYSQQGQQFTTENPQNVNLNAKEQLILDAIRGQGSEDSDSGINQLKNTIFDLWVKKSLGAIVPTRKEARKYAEHD